MKILFVVYCEFKEGVGVCKKIEAQNRAFIDNNSSSDIYHWGVLANGHRVSYINDSIYEDYGNGLFGKIKIRLCRENMINYIVENNVTHVYIRYEFFADYLFLRLLKTLKEKGICVILEIPTYPYDNELKGINAIDKLFQYVEKIYRKNMHNYVRRVVTYSNEDAIFNIPTIKISNGIDFNIIPHRYKSNIVDRIITFIGVANLAFWHGYDRVIRGMYNYLQKGSYIVRFHIVGEGNEEYRNELRRLTKELFLDSFVFFHNNTDGNELTKLFEEANLAIGSLGRHRSGINQLKTLKNVEYAARGIPFVYSETDENFDNMLYTLKMPADDTPIDIEKVISFYFSEKWSGESIRQSIENELSWTQQMKKVVDTFSECF